MVVKWSGDGECTVKSDNGVLVSKLTSSVDAWSWQRVWLVHISETFRDGCSIIIRDGDPQSSCDLLSERGSFFADNRPEALNHGFIQHYVIRNPQFTAEVVAGRTSLGAHGGDAQVVEAKITVCESLVNTV